MKSYTCAANLLDNQPDGLTSGQRACLEQLASFVQDPHPYSIFVLRGYAGTGKTFLLRLLAEAASEAGMPLELLATTGRAAKQLSQATGRAASTIHRRIYRSASELIERGGSYRLETSTQADSLIIVDEASMISGATGEVSPFGSGDLLDDLLSFAWQAEGTRVVLVGDAAQLPPVGCELSDALNTEILQAKYGLKVYECELTEVVRQEEGSDILSLATHLRTLLQAYADEPSDAPIPLSLDLRQLDRGQVSLVSSCDLVDELDSAYRRYGMQECLVVTPSNKRALSFNLGIRAQVLDFEEALERGDRLIVARNNYHYAERRDRSDFIANGEQAEIVHLRKYHDMYGLSFVDATLRLPERDREIEARILLSGLSDEQPQRSYAQRSELFEQIALDYEHIASITERRRSIRRDPYWGALEVKYGYAVTAHKAQGGQWRCVFIDLGLMKLLPMDQSMLRWLYTSITRATERLYLVNAPEEFFIWE